jgi:hypothetical protein
VENRVFVACPKISLKHMFCVKRHNFFITDPNSVRPNVLVRVQSIVFFVHFSDPYNKYSVWNTLYKFAL